MGRCKSQQVYCFYANFHFYIVFDYVLFLCYVFFIDIDDLTQHICF